jgi:hypothetical protein
MRRVQLALALTGALVSVAGLVYAGKGLSIVLVGLLAVGPFALYLWAVRTRVGVWVIGLLLPAITLPLFIEALSSRSSTAGLRLLATIPNNFSVVGVGIGVEGVLRFIHASRDSESPGMDAKNRKGKSERMHLPWVTLMVPILVGMIAWSIAAQFAYRPSPWATWVFWLPVMTTALALGVLTAAQPMWSVGALLMAGPSLGALIRGIQSPEGDLLFLPLRLLPYVGGAFFLGFLAWAANRAAARLHLKHETANSYSGIGDQGSD